MLGARIRALRDGRGMSAKELAEASGLSQSAVSQIERGVVDPSLRSLRSIAQTLDTPIFALFLDSSSRDIVVRGDRRRSFSPPDYGGRYELLSPDSDGQVEMIYMSVEPGASSSQEPLPHSGDECMFVLRGRAEVIAGGESFELQTGDSIYLNAGLPHRVTNVGAEVLECVVAVAPPGF